MVFSLRLLFTKFQTVILSIFHQARVCRSEKSAEAAQQPRSLFNAFQALLWKILSSPHITTALDDANWNAWLEGKACELDVGERSLVRIPWGVIWSSLHLCTTVFHQHLSVIHWSFQPRLYVVPEKLKLTNSTIPRLDYNMQVSSCTHWPLAGVTCFCAHCMTPWDFIPLLPATAKSPPAYLHCSKTLCDHLCVYLSLILCFKASLDTPFSS